MVKKFFQKTDGGQFDESNSKHQSHLYTESDQKVLSEVGHNKCHQKFHAEKPSISELKETSIERWCVPVSSQVMFDPQIGAYKRKS